MSLRPRRDGEPIGPKRTISAASVAEMLGLKEAPPPEAPLPDSPAAARLRGEGKAKQADALMEAAKTTHIEQVVPAGWDVAALLGVRPEELPVGVEQELGPRPKRPHRDDGWQPDGSYTGAVNAPEPSAAERAKAEKLRAQYRAHAADAASRAEASRGDADAEARAAAEIREVAEIGSKLKAKLEKLGLPL